MDEKLVENIIPHKKYRLDEVASETILNCSVSMVYKLIYLEKLVSVSVGTRHRVPGWSIVEYMQENIKTKKG